MSDQPQARQLAIYLNGFNAETYDRADDPAADAQGHVVTATVLRRPIGDASLVPVRVRVGHGVSPATAAAMLRKMADLIEKNPDLLNAMPGLAVRRTADGGSERRRITPEGLAAFAATLGPDERDRMLEMIERIREQITDDPSPDDML
jgi:hypothetical protein